MADVGETLPVAFSTYENRTGCRDLDLIERSGRFRGVIVFAEWANGPLIALPLARLAAADSVNSLAKARARSLMLSICLVSEFRRCRRGLPCF